MHLLSRATVLLTVAVGAGAAVPPGAQVIHGRGLSVYPSMMDTGKSLRLNEVPPGAHATVDDGEVGSFDPNSIAHCAMTPHNAHIGVTRVVGVTQVLSGPTGGIASGQATLADLGGWTPAAMTIQRKAGLVITLPRAGGGGLGFGRGGFGGGAAAGGADAMHQRMTQIDSLDALIADARAHRQEMDTCAKNRSLPRPQRGVKLAAMVPYVRGDLPVLLQADRAVELRASVEFAVEQGLKPIIGGHEARVTALLNEKNVPVIDGSERTLPSRDDDPYDINFSAHGQLAVAGVRLAIGSVDNGAQVRDLPYVAGMAAVFGRSPEDELRSVTLWPPRIFGRGDRFGSLEVGGGVHLVVVDGDVLEARTGRQNPGLESERLDPFPVDVIESFAQGVLDRTCFNGSVRPRNYLSPMTSDVATAVPSCQIGSDALAMRAVGASSVILATM